MTRFGKRTWIRRAGISAPSIEAAQTQHAVSSMNHVREQIILSDRSGCVVWFTGFSGAGKSTLAEGTRQRLAALGWAVELLDADVIRPLLCKGLGYSHEDRLENIRRIAFVANLLARHGCVVLVAAIAPYRAARAEVRRNAVAYIEVYVNAPLEVCERRDTKGLYQRARAGEIINLTGYDDVYEAPESPDVECRTDRESVEACVERILHRITSR
jgi:adenylyl-sulfate kinase